MKNRYRRNLDILAVTCPRAEEFLGSNSSPQETSHDTPEERSSEVEKMSSRSGLPTVRFRGRFIHSKLDPEREAKRIVHRVIDTVSEVYVFLGFGYGYHIEEFLRAFPEAVVITVEREPALLRAAMEERELEPLFADSRFRLLIGPELSELEHALLPFAKKKLEPVLLDQFTSSEPQYYRDAAARVREIGSRREVNMATLRRFGRLWIRNLVKNLTTLAEAENAGNLEGKAKGLPVLLLAAGPSLDDILPYIEEAKKRALIVAVDTAAGALAACGTAPDIVVVVDPQYWNTRHLDTLISNGNLFADTFLVSESSTHPHIFRFPFGKIFMGGSVFPLGEYLEEATGPKRKLGAGGSVATTAWDVARLIGAGEIYVSGLDLGFPDGKTHYSGGFFEQLLHSVSDRFLPYSHRSFSYIMNGDPSYYRNNSGRNTLTDKRLSVYRRWFEEQLSRSGSPPTFSLSPKAIAIEGMEYRSADLFLSLPERRAEIETAMAGTGAASDAGHAAAPKKPPHNDEPDRKPKEELFRRAEQLLEELELLRSTAERGIRATEKLLDKSDISSDISTEELKTLDSIDEMILASAGKDVAGFLIQPVLDDLTCEMENPESIGESIRNSGSIYRELFESARYHISLFTHSLGRTHNQ